MEGGGDHIAASVFVYLCVYVRGEGVWEKRMMIQKQVGI